MRVLCDILLRSRKTCAILQCDDAIVLKKKQCSCLIRRIIRNGDCRTIRDVCKIRGLAGIDAKRLIVNLADGNNVCALFLIEIIKIWCVLEIVCIDLALINSKIRLYIIIIGDDLNVYTSGRQRILCCLENLSVRRW